jgi:hypothetical protein
VRALRRGGPEHIEDPLTPQNDDMTKDRNRISADLEGFSGGRASCAILRESALAEAQSCSQCFDYHRSITGEYVTKIFPCSAKLLLLKGSTEAARDATSGDVIWLARTFSSFNQFRDHKNRTEVHYQAAQSIGSGVDPYISDKMEKARLPNGKSRDENQRICFGVF